MKIAIEPTLTHIKDYLSGMGHQVDSMAPNTQFTKNLQNYDAVVVTGLSKNLLGVEDTETKARVINAEGLTPQDVAKEIERFS
jgi:hypothetical protein